MRLSEPGIYGLEDLGGDVASYYNDPAPGESLNQTLTKVLLSGCAKLAWWGHPRLNPAYEPPEPTPEQDFGTVAHFVLTGVGRGYKILEYDNFRKTVAQAERDTCRAMGAIPILRRQYENILSMVDVLRAALPKLDGGYAFDSGYGEMEVCALARDVHGCWIRCLIDFYGYRVPDGVACWDYKTTSGSANPNAIMYQASVNGWAIQAAFQDRVLTTLKPHLSGKIRYRFLVQETKPPYLVSAVAPSPGAFAMAQERVDAATKQWAHCLATDSWPGYPADVADFYLLPSIEAQWLRQSTDPASSAGLAFPSGTGFPPPERSSQEPLASTAAPPPPPSGADQLPPALIAKPRRTRRLQPPKSQAGVPPKRGEP